MTRGARVFLLHLLLAGGAAAQTTPLAPELKAENTSFDLATGDAVLTGHPRIEYGSTLLLADELRYSRSKNLATATGHVSITAEDRRLLADRGTYNFVTGQLTLVHVRAGEPPLHFTADSAEGTKDNLSLTNATVVYGEPAAFSPVLRADSLDWIHGLRLTGHNVRLGFGDFRFFPLPRIDQDIKEPFISHVTAHAGYRGSLGAIALLGLHLPVAPGWKLGGDLGIFTNRGVMLGPSGEYRRKSGENEAAGAFRSGFILDHGDRLTDLLGRPIPKERGLFEWNHRQRLGQRLTLSGQLYWWKDSEIVRDFYAAEFKHRQQPDSWLEAVYAGDNYQLSAFARLQPNDFHVVRERLPEIRFDLMPLSIGGGFYERFHASFAALRDDPPGGGPGLRSDRLDAYYALSRPLTAGDWLSITPMAGGRATYYARTNPGSGRDNYTRWLGELGVDAELHASGTFDYHNQLWGINGLRHLLTPRISYRYVPEIERGAAYIPPIDRRIFSTSLDPIGLGAIRNIDDLHGTEVLRVGLDNTLQTRDGTFGSRDLLAFQFAADARLRRKSGERLWSDIHAALELTPAPWLRFDLRQRFSARTFALREVTGDLAITDGEAWALRASTQYLQHQIEEYALEGQLRLNETWRAQARLRYDAKQCRWNEQIYGLTQNLGNVWRIRYEISWQQGGRRESPFGFSLGLNLLRF
ncbi:MAG: hypothetical protein A3G75_12810 [Verrucomicrobia bacterium RIFCSPLOWO2_12_FULL_64_8]|nr:MAG: hypothetical protein A3G75_12810 [Verrucomicrobia bacterium RIFCSPLOWO2_12_FULL_64_8]